MSFSDLVHAVEHDLGGVVQKVERLLPAGLPSDTREVAALAEDAAHVAVALDPELEPIFQAIGSVGNTIEGALQELGGHIGHLKVTLAKRAAAPLAASQAAALPGEVPVGVPDPGAPQPAAGPQPSTTDLQRAADTAALARQANATETEAADPNPLSAPAETSQPSDSATSTDAPPAPAAASTEATPSPIPGTADPAGANPPEDEVPAAETPGATALEDAEADFESLSPEDRAAFEEKENLETAVPPPPLVPPGQAAAATEAPPA